MDIWYLKDFHRLSLERKALQDLEDSTDWLIGMSWGLDGGLIVIDAVIRAHGIDYPVRLSYPTVFPAAPPVVQPKNPDQRWSAHQYGDGTLCLEWGPDTWHPDVTGAQVLESAHKLLHMENPLGTGEREVAPTRHRLTVGQTLRNTYGRVYVNNDLKHYLSALPTPISGGMDISTRWQSKSATAFIQKIHPAGMSEWNDSTIPQGIRSATDTGIMDCGVFYKTHLDEARIKKIKDVGGIERILSETGGANVSFADHEYGFDIQPEKPPSGVLLVDESGTSHFFLLVGQQSEQGAFLFHPIYDDENDMSSRFPSALEGLAEKSVGIVGLGSVGSKMALSLARMGVRHFFLVDEDIFLPGNVCRHALDWRNVGEHKVNAVEEMLSCIAPDMQIEVSRVHLAGQESTAVLNGVLNKLGQCDLIVDATAEPDAFNEISAVATTFSKPLLWMEVYAGGIGGMIARSRPEYDPDPHTMRAVYNHHTSETPLHDMQIVGDYTAVDNDHILAASDADVGVIANHAARLAVDTVLNPQPSTFPHSIYLIGLNKAWIFEAPFDTIPIATDNVPKKRPSKVMSKDDIAQNVAFLSDLIKQSTT